MDLVTLRHCPSMQEHQMEERLVGRAAAKAESDAAARAALRDSGAADEYLVRPPGET